MSILKVVVFQVRSNFYILYDINGEYVNTVDLTKVGPLRTLGNKLYEISLDISTLTSQPLLIHTENGGILLMTDGNNVVPLNSSSPDVMNQSTLRTSKLAIPNMSSYNTVNINSRLEAINLPPFNPDIKSEIEQSIINYQAPLSAILNNMTAQGIYTVQTPRTHLPQFGSNVFLISFDAVKTKLSNGSFNRFDFLPQYQTVPHNFANYIASFYGKDGNIYLSELRYDQSTNEIFPPY